MLLADADRLARELKVSALAPIAAEIALLAGDAAEAERWLLAELETLEEIGDWGHYVSIVPPYVEALVMQGRGTEARGAVEVAARWAIDDDMDGQIGLHSSEAALLLLDGEVVAAEERARAGVRIAAGTDYTRARIRMLSTLADVLGEAGRPDEAREVIEEAIVLAEEKESVAHERILRAKLDEVSCSAARDCLVGRQVRCSRTGPLTCSWTASRASRYAK